MIGIPLQQMLIDRSNLTIHTWAQVTVDNNDNEMMLSLNKENYNLAKDPGLRLDFSSNNVAYWLSYGPSDCQHHMVHL